MKRLHPSRFWVVFGLLLSLLLAACASPADGGPPAEPSWMLFLKSDAAVAQEECVKDLALFAEVPDGNAPRLASALGLLAGPLPSRAKPRSTLVR